MTDGAAPAVLLTMPLSHYAEKARWALDRVALPYREEPHVPLFHREATTRSGGADLLYPREPAMREEVLRLRGSDAGQFTLRLFSQERGDSPDVTR